MGILISINEKGGLWLSTLCFCTISQRALTCRLEFEPHYKQLLLTIISTSISIVDFKWREKDTLTSQYGSS